MLLRLRTSSSLMGTPPPTKPVFPPWGTIAIPRSLQYLTISLTSLVVRGRSTVVDLPWYLFIQSLLKLESSDAGVKTGDSVESIDDAGRIFWKCVMSCSVTGLKLNDGVVCAQRRTERCGNLRAILRAANMVVRDRAAHGGWRRGPIRSNPRRFIR